MLGPIRASKSPPLQPTIHYLGPQSGAPGIAAHALRLLGYGVARADNVRDVDKCAGRRHRAGAGDRRRHARRLADRASHRRRRQRLGARADRRAQRRRSARRAPRGDAQRGRGRVRAARRHRPHRAAPGRTDRRPLRTVSRADRRRRQFDAPVLRLGPAPQPDGDARRSRRRKKRCRRCTTSRRT